MAAENRTARLTLLIDPEKKAVLEELCRGEDLTPSQVVRRLIRGYIEQKLGRPWQPSGGASAVAPNGTPRKADRKPGQRAR